MSFLFPTPEEVAAAVAWAIDERRMRVRSTPRGLLLSESALQERISGYAIRPEPCGIGWWIVGVLVDATDVQCSEYSILTVQGGMLLRTKPRYQVEPPKAPKPSRWYFSGATKRWELNPDLPGDEHPPDFIPGEVGDNDPPDFHGR